MSLTSRTSRPGFTLLECLVAAAMLCAVFVLVGQLFVWDGYDRRAAWNRQVALQEASNQLERLAAAPYDSLTEEQLTGLPLSEEARTWLPDGELHIGVSEVTTPRAGKRIQVEVRWGGKNQVAVPPVRLVAWRFATGGSP